MTSARRFLLLVAAYAVPAIAAMNMVTDPDIWCHLQTGRWIVEHGGAPMTDPFSVYEMGKPWVAYSWLFDLIVYGFYRAFGLVGIVLYTALSALLVAGALHAFLRTCRLSALEEIALLVAGVFGIRTLLSPRPWFFTIVFFVIELTLIMQARRTGQRRRLWLLVPMFALWANVHVQFVYGLIVLGLAAVEPLLARMAAGHTDHVEPEATAVPFRVWATILAASVVATLATPYHVHLYEVIATLIVQFGVYQHVTELQALGFRALEDWVVLAITLTAAFSLGRSRDVRIFPTMLLLVGTVLSFRASRDVWVVTMAAVAVVATARAKRATGDPLLLTRGRILAAGAAIVLVMAAAATIRHVSDDGLSATVAQNFPAAAAAVVEARGYEGPLYNHFNWGGYLMWRLPRHPVAIDGRIDVHRSDRIERSQATWSGRADWRTDQELARARLIIAGQSFALTSLLRQDPRFNLVYEDNVAAVFVAARRVL